MDTPSPSSSGSWSAPSLDSLNRILPQYEFHEMLGRGGMGAVFLARQLSLERLAAIKILPAELAEIDPAFAKRFQSEGQTLARLRHPGIVEVYDSGKTASGMLWFAMEYVEGTDVAKMIAAEGRLDPFQAQAILTNVCAALTAAHEIGLMHRDIKPANVLISREGDVKVADFGLARSVNAEFTALTHSDVAMGTPHYIAPESFIPGLELDHRADLYATGVMLYEMLTGRIPTGIFQPPSQRVPGLDPRFDKVVTRALRDDRELRYQSAAELHRDLDALLSVPVPQLDAAPGTIAGSPAVPSPKSSLLFPVGLAATIIVIALLGYGVWSRFSEHEAVQLLTKTETPKAESTVPAPEPLNPEPAKVVDTAPASPPKTTTTLAAVPKKPAPQPTVTETKTVATVTTPPPPIPAAVTPPAPVVAEPSPLDFPEFVRLRAIRSADWAEKGHRPCDEGIAKLRKNYLFALTRETSAARASANESLAEALTEETLRFQTFTSQPMPAEDPADLPERLKQLRVTYRTEAARLEQARLASAEVAKSGFLNDIETLSASITPDPLARRPVLKALHDALAEGRLSLEAIFDLSSTIRLDLSAPVTTGSPAPGTSPGNPTVYMDDFDTEILSTDWRQQGNAWHCLGGAVTTKKIYLDDAKDRGWGCWLAKDLPENFRLEFDLLHREEDECSFTWEVMGRPAEGSTKSIPGYRIKFELPYDRQKSGVILRGLAALPTAGSTHVRGGQQHFHVVIERKDGRTLSYSLNGTDELRATDPNPLRSGWFGLHSEGYLVMIDNLKIYDLAQPGVPDAVKKPAPIDETSTLMMGQVRNSRDQPVPQAIVRLCGEVSTKTDDLGRFAIKRVVTGDYELRAEHAQGELHRRFYQGARLLKGPGKTQEVNFTLEDVPLVGIRWVIQTKAGNPALEGPGTESGEAWFSQSHADIDLMRGCAPEVPTNSQQKRAEFDFSLTIDGRKVYFKRPFEDGLSGWHKEKLSFEKITSVNEGRPFNDREYFHESLQTGDEVELGDVFTLRNYTSNTYAKLEVIHVPD